MYLSNSDLIKRAHSVFPGASLGSFFLPDEHDLVVAGGSGARVRDMEGREYIDYVLGSGPMILGHAHPAVVAAVKEQVERGASYYALNEPSILLAEEIIAASGSGEMAKFCGSGSEATFYALRLARAATGRPKILKFEGAYHGHHDYAMVSTTPSKPAAFPAAEPDTAGIPPATADQTLIAPFNDLPATLQIIDTHAKEIAAIIVEPECRVISPKPGFLEGLREASRKQGIVLIFDEVVTGFRARYGGAQEMFNVRADLLCYGKIIGGGYPLAAVVGKREVMELSNPRAKKNAHSVYISGTLNGNPVAAAAGLATLAELRKPGAYERLGAVGNRLRKGLQAITQKLGIPAQVIGTGPTANVYFTSQPVYDYRSSQTEDKQLKQKLRSALLKRGILNHLAAKIYLSAAHTDAEIDQTLEKTEDGLKEVART